MELGGSQTTEGTSVASLNIFGNKARVHGYHTSTLANGEKLYGCREGRSKEEVEVLLVSTQGQRQASCVPREPSRYKDPTTRRACVSLAIHSCLLQTTAPFSVLSRHACNHRHLESLNPGNQLAASNRQDGGKASVNYVMIVVLAVLAVLGMFSDIHSYTGKRLP